MTSFPPISTPRTSSVNQEYHMNAQGVHKYQIRFSPLSSLTNNQPRARNHLSKSSSNIPSHVSTCTCKPCRILRKTKRTTVGTVYYQPTSIRLVGQVLEQSGLVPSSTKLGTVIWSSKILKSYSYATLKKFQRVNQFPHSFQLTRKDNLSKNVSIMASRFGREAFDFLPHGFSTSSLLLLCLV